MKRTIEFTIETTIRKWREIYRTVNKITDEFCARIGKNGMRIRIVDPAHVWMGDINVSKHFFKTYRINKTQTIALSTDWIQHVTRKVKGSYMMALTYYSDGVCTYTIYYPWGDYVSKRFQLDKEGIKQPKVPTMMLDQEIHIDDDMFRQAIEKLSEYYFIKIRTTKQQLQLSYSWTNDDYEEKENEGDQFTIPLKNTKHKTSDAIALYGADYLQDIIKAMPKTIKIKKIRFKSDYPMEMHFERTNKQKQKEIKILYILAPRIEHED